MDKTASTSYDLTLQQFDEIDSAQLDKLTSTSFYDLAVQQLGETNSGQYKDIYLLQFTERLTLFLNLNKALINKPQLILGLDQISESELNFEIAKKQRALLMSFLSGVVPYLRGRDEDVLLSEITSFTGSYRGKSTEEIAELLKVFCTFNKLIDDHIENHIPYIKLLEKTQELGEDVHDILVDFVIRFCKTPTCENIYEIYSGPGRNKFFWHIKIQGFTISDNSKRFSKAYHLSEIVKLLNSKNKLQLQNYLLELKESYSQNELEEIILLLYEKAHLSHKELLSCTIQFSNKAAFFEKVIPILSNFAQNTKITEEQNKIFDFFGKFFKYLNHQTQNKLATTQLFFEYVSKNKGTSNSIRKQLLNSIFESFNEDTFLFLAGGMTSTELGDQIGKVKNNKAIYQSLIKKFIEVGFIFDLNNHQELELNLYRDYIGMLNREIPGELVDYKSRLFNNLLAQKQKIGFFTQYHNVLSNLSEDFLGFKEHLELIKNFFKNNDLTKQENFVSFKKLYSYYNKLSNYKDSAYLSSAILIVGLNKIAANGDFNKEASEILVLITEEHYKVIANFTAQEIDSSNLLKIICQLPGTRDINIAPYNLRRVFAYIETPASTSRSKKQQNTRKPTSKELLINNIFREDYISINRYLAAYQNNDDVTESYIQECRTLSAGSKSKIEKITSFSKNTEKYTENMSLSIDEYFRVTKKIPHLSYSSLFQIQEFLPIIYLNKEVFYNALELDTQSDIYQASKDLMASTDRTLHRMVEKLTALKKRVIATASDDERDYIKSRFATFTITMDLYNSAISRLNNKTTEDNLPVWIQAEGHFFSTELLDMYDRDIFYPIYESYFALFMKQYTEEVILALTPYNKTSNHLPSILEQTDYLVDLLEKIRNHDDITSQIANLEHYKKFGHRGEAYVETVTSLWNSQANIIQALKATNLFVDFYVIRDQLDKVAFSNALNELRESADSTSITETASAVEQMKLFITKQIYTGSAIFSPTPEAVEAESSHTHAVSDESIKKFIRLTGSFSDKKSVSTESSSSSNEDRARPREGVRTANSDKTNTAKHL
jgi:hypothetical protein